MERGRWVLLPGAVLVALLWLSAPAQAKGPGFEGNTPTSGEATISAPGLAPPLVLPWHGGCLEYCTSLQDWSPFVDLMSGAGVFGFRGDVTRTTPPAGELGPRYDVAFLVTLEKGQIERASVEMYPFGPGDLPPYVRFQPWFHIPSGLRMLGRPVESGWWPGSPTLLRELEDLGLPRSTPAGPSGSSGSGLVAAGVAAFGVLLLVGALAGRPRRRIQA